MIDPKSTATDPFEEARRKWQQIGNIDARREESSESTILSSVIIAVRWLCAVVVSSAHHLLYSKDFWSVLRVDYSRGDK